MRVAIGAACLFAMFSTIWSSIVCDICQCLPSDKDAVYLKCDCGAFKHLHLTSSLMVSSVLQSTQSVVIQNCHTVSIEKNSFAQLGRLTNLTLCHCRHLYFDTEVLSRLEHLVLDTVDDACFKSMATLNEIRNLRTISIANSNVSKLPARLFHRVIELELLKLDRVVVGTVETEAIDVVARNVVLEHCKIHKIESRAIKITSQKLVLKHTTIGLLEPNSATITNKLRTRIVANNFSSVFNIALTSFAIEFHRNVFKNFDSKIVAANVTFTRNTFESVNLNQIAVLLNRGWRFENNVILWCNCCENRIGSCDTEVLERNFCTTNCNVSMGDFIGLYQKSSCGYRSNRAANLGLFFIVFFCTSYKFCCC